MTNPVLDDRECERCNGSGIIGLRSRTGSYVGPGPVPEDARGFLEATCDVCRGSGIDVDQEKTTTSEFDRESIAKCLFHTAMAGHAQWDDISKPNKDDWRAKADIWILDVTNLKARRAALSVPVSSPPGSGK